MTYDIAIELPNGDRKWRRFRTAAADLDMVRTLAAVKFGTRDFVQITDAETGETLWRLMNGRGA